MRKTKQLFIIGLVSTHLFLNVAYPLGLSESYNLALSNDPTFRAALKEHEANEANLMIGTSAILPKLNYSANFATNRLTNTYPGGISQTFDNYPSVNNYVQVLQPLFDLVALAKYRQGVIQKQYGDVKFQIDTMDLLLKTTQLYMDILFNEDNIVFLKIENDTYLNQIKIAEKGIKSGESSRFDYLESKTAYDLSVAQMLEAELQLNDSKRKLGILIGLVDGNLVKLSKLRSKYIFFSDLSKNFDELKTITFDNSLEMRASRLKVELAKQEIDKNKANYYPQINAITSWSRQNSYTVATINTISNQTTTGLQATWPLFSSGETTGLTRQAISLYEKSKEEYDSFSKNIISDLQKYYDQTSSFNSKITILKSSLESAEEVKKATILGISAGLKSNYDVLVAAKNVSKISKDLAQAKYAYILSYLKTKQIAGLLKVDDLENCANIYFEN